MTSPNCRICGSGTTRAFKHRILNKYDCEYWSCGTCGLLQTEPPHWLEEAYSAPIASADTGILLRNLTLSPAVTPLLYFMFDRNGRFLDTAGGYGIFTRLMRDIGFDYYWEDEYSPNLVARGFVANAGHYEAVTAFEVLEHLTDPVGFVGKLLERTDTIIFSTELFSGPPPNPDWWYYAFATGQHISFYQEGTLRYLAGQFGLQLHTVGQLHILTRKKLNKWMLRVVTAPQASRILIAAARRSLTPRTVPDHEDIISTS